ncbi:hypothetical protein ACQP00_31340 [Dactylosporangium sp. CS-047395]|uniref:hypothetical protein n=1 Tax=Dactylosporangium sp. CS-047395 TaxID=3239936 RepID=UPI003D8AA189
MSGALAARGWADEDTVALPVQPAPGTDPLAALVAEVQARNGSRFVDGLQLAALLESAGVTDRAARDRYGYYNAFELADAVRTRLAEDAGAEEPSAHRPARAGGVREILHGGLYLLPSALFPAVLAASPRPPVLAIVAAGLLGWVWAGAMTWLAHQHVNAGDEPAAGRLLARASLAGVAVAAALGAALAATGAGTIAAALVPAVAAYQLAATVLLFYRDEGWLVTLMSPAVVAGGGYLLAGRWSPVAAILPALACVAITFGVAVSRARRVPGTGSERGLRAAMAGRWGTFVLVVCSTALLAALVLLSQAPYLTGRLDVLVATLPLAVSMGFVEWRARRFGERARDLLHGPWNPGRLRLRLWRFLATDVFACALVAAGAAVVALALLRRAGQLTPAAEAMAAASVVLAGACLLVFVLAAHGGHGRLCVALAIALAAHAAVPFLGSTVLLLGVLALVLAPSVGRVRQYR